MSDHFFAVTGGPGTGKTSLITELARRDFQTIPESGRAIIREEMQTGGDALPWADRMEYANGCWSATWAPTAPHRRSKAP
ncbi:AAA family ATPase [Leisingera aquaemixtae]|uniref:AAA family ATPase n=1 Tax=Leisingera aquaemixtae TaxID=1396826 RepID=UPI0021A83031|nr:AAA family ATPase [Leisingera aquaemixtae]